MNTAFLLTGGNVGDRAGFLTEAAFRITAGTGHVLQNSSIYETAPWGNPDQAPFLNQVLRIRTGLEASSLLDHLLDIERQLGRARAEKYGPRTIDIDILFFNQEIIRSTTLVVPHPHLAERRFVLVGVADQ